MAASLLTFILAACATTGTAQNTPTREDGRAKLATAEAIFAERCAVDVSVEAHRQSQRATDGAGQVGIGPPRLGCTGDEAEGRR